jgi:hypothetical protein
VNGPGAADKAGTGAPTRDELLAHLVGLAEAYAIPPCVTYPHAGWTSDSHNDQAYAARVCARCPGLTPCRAYGLANPTELGVYGALTTIERQRAAQVAAAS